VRVTSSRAESHSDDAGTGVVFEARLAILMLLGEIVVKRRNYEVKNERLPSFLVNCRTNKENILSFVPSEVMPVRNERGAFPLSKKQAEATVQNARVT